MSVSSLSLTGANKEALAVAKAAGANFIRAEGFVFSHVADEGWMDSCAGELLRYRKTIGAEDVMVFTDIKKKHWYMHNNALGAFLGITSQSFVIPWSLFLRNAVDPTVTDISQTLKSPSLPPVPTL